MSGRKTMWNEGHKKTSRRYFVPPHSANPRSAHLEVCRSTFLNLFTLGLEGKWVDKISKRDQSKPAVLEVDKRKGKSGRKSKWDDEIHDHLKSFSLVTSHYSNTAQQGKAVYLFDAELCPTQIWMLWCDIYDKEYAEQARRNSYWRSYDKKQPGPLDQDGVAWIKSELAHSTYMYKTKKYDLRFGKIVVDSCATCDAFRLKIAAEESPTERAKLEKKWADHKEVADGYYCARRADEARTKKEFEDWDPSFQSSFCSFRGMDTQCQDAAGTLRIPRISSGQAYYKRILPLTMYCMYSAGTSRATMCGWQENEGKKGANEIISAEHYHHMNHGTGSEALELWEDMCLGQIFNWDGTMYHCHITDPDSPMHMYGRIDEKALEVGHSYSGVDRLFGQAQRAAKQIPVIADAEDWFKIYRECNKKDPFHVHHMEQKEFRDWHSYLTQYYIKSGKDFEGLKMAFQGAHWRNYGYGPELCSDGEVRIVHHPGEVWFKYDLDVRTPWVKVDLRRNATKKFQGFIVAGDDGIITNILTCDLPDLKEEPDGIDDERFDLYDGPIPISKAKYDDLVSLCEYLPVEKRQQYYDLVYDASIVDPGDESNVPTDSNSDNEESD